MNTKLSGAQLVLVPITQMGRNFFPYVEHIANRVVKFIDFAPSALLPNTKATGLQTTQDLFVTIVDETGTHEIHRQLPLERLDYSATTGVRQPLFKLLTMDACYIDCQNSAAVGTVAALVFWYDLPQYSAANKSDFVQTDSIEIPITNVTQYNVLPDSDRMTGKRFRRLLLGTPTTTPESNVGVAFSNLTDCYLTLCKGSYKILADCPLQLLYQLQMLEKTEFQNIMFDFQSSYITVGGAGTADINDYIWTDSLGVKHHKYIFMNLQYEA